MLTGKFPGDISGADLPALTNPAVAGDMASGKQAIAQDGGVVTGTLPSLADAKLAGHDIAQEGAELVLRGEAQQDGILRAGDFATVGVPMSALGDATAADVVGGKMFSSSAGLKETGTLEAPSALDVLADAVSAGTVQGQLAVTLSGPLGNDCVLRNGASIDVSAQASAFGNAAAADVKAGKTFTSAEGLKVPGVSTAVETGDATAAAEDIALGKTAYVNGVKIVGTGASVPVGGIVMWSGAANAIPAGWALCNGTNNTPDLRGKFVVGAGGSYSVGNTGGADKVILTANQMPSHTHATTEAIDGSYGASLVYSAQNGMTKKYYGVNDVKNYAGIGSAGGGEAHENLPPYYALCYIMRTA